MKRSLAVFALLLAASTLAFSQSRTEAQTWLSSPKAVKRAAIHGYTLGVKSVMNKIGVILWRYIDAVKSRSGAPENAEPPGAPVANNAEIDYEPLIAEMDAFFKRPENAAVSLFEALNENCYPGKGKAKKIGTE